MGLATTWHDLRTLAAPLRHAASCCDMLRHAAPCCVMLRLAQAPCRARLWRCRPKGCNSSPTWQREFNNKHKTCHKTQETHDATVRRCEWNSTRKRTLYWLCSLGYRALWGAPDSTDIHKGDGPRQDAVWRMSAVQIVHTPCKWNSSSL